jgi:DNA polymerase III delta subunit
MPSKSFLKELERGLPSPVYYIWSEEEVFLAEALEMARKTVLASHPPDFNCDLFYSTASPEEILDAVNTLPFMAPRRLVVLKEFHQFPASTVKTLTPAFRDSSDTTCLLILSRKAPGSSKDPGWKVLPLGIRDREIPAWLKRVSAEKGLKISDTAVSSLIEFAGNDIGLLLMEIDKLTLGGRKEVTERDVILSASSVREYTSFELVDAIAAGQKARAFRILRTSLAGTAAQATVILGTLNWHYRQFYSLWQNKGRRPAKMKDATYRRLAKYLPSFNENRFYSIFRSLHEADVGIKTSGRPEVALEVLLIRLLQSGVAN